ncbi:subclass B1 metallo-beta-lactamase [Alkaliphilus hydrothermalis]|uniref:beta-lactamase n=1 Tax=Alkaliphilus hydrothermalis TaxID=1482730 RepID=A0ABS2NTK6_9FIRM|nr:subclass B1 metallo-beta-lactamase [Alkaliphilus hydrothermalis]MBM7616241.1 metallo-beta-lactamase class B [Alkaliphilus hydrothermalis]
MKRVTLLMTLIISVAMVLSACVGFTSTNVKKQLDYYKSGTIEDDHYVELTKINDHIWVHTTYENYNGYKAASNGVVAVTSKGLVLIDTPWNNEQTKELIKLTKSIFNKDITIAIITHAHADRIGGIRTLLENNIEVRSTSMTALEAEKNGFEKPEPTLDEESVITVGDLDMDIFYPGEGHSVDNITVWFPKYKILFGGCLIKSLESENLGSIEDANLQQWPSSVEKVLGKYGDAEVVIPGHGKWGSIQLVRHTLELLGK